MFGVPKACFQKLALSEFCHQLEIFTKSLEEVRMEIKRSPICSEAERVDQYLAVDGDVARNKKNGFLQRQKILQMREFLYEQKTPYEQFVS